MPIWVTLPRCTAFQAYSLPLLPALILPIVVYKHAASHISALLRPLLCAFSNVEQLSPTAQDVCQCRAVVPNCSGVGNVEQLSPTLSPTAQDACQKRETIEDNCSTLEPGTARNHCDWRFFRGRWSSLRFRLPSPDGKSAQIAGWQICGLLLHMGQPQKISEQLIATIGKD